MRRAPYQQNPPRYDYHLTDAGRALEPVVLQIMAFGHEHLGDPKTGKSVKAAH